LKYAEEELLNMSPLDIVDESHPSAYESKWKFLQKLKEASYTSVFKSKDGVLVPLELHAKHVIYGGRNLVLVAGRDMTNRLKSDRKQSELIRTLELSLASAELGMWSLDITSGKLEWDDRLLEIYDLSRAEFGESFGDWERLVHPDDLEGTSAKLSEALKGESILSISYRIVLKTGVIKNLEASAIPLKDDRNEIVSVVGINRDITEQVNSKKRLKEALSGTVDVAMTLSELRDPYTSEHEERVAFLAAAIGNEMDYGEDFIVGLLVAGKLHDIGKMVVPAEILAKPGKLSPIEYSLVQGHALAEYDVTKGVDLPWPVAEVAYQHHERLDGSGYPQGLKGEEIILEARIMAVADVVEAMSSHRLYRAGLDIDRALEEIERGRATIYEGVIVDACLRLFREKSFTWPE
jgi:PAS domain S-box-containing protein